MTTQEALELWKKLGDAGVTVSVAYGPMGIAREMRYSVDFARGLETIPVPFAATSLEHAIDIARRESIIRGWVKGTQLC